MAHTARLEAARVAILGLGLMGGSLALALRGKCAALLGSDPDPQVLALARQRQVVDRLSSEPAKILPQADLVVLAAPVRVILHLLQQLPGLHPGQAVVLDLGSTKDAILQAMADLPSRFDPIGGHPICGKEALSLANAEASLYRGAPFVFTPLERTSERARSLAQELAEAVGAAAVFTDARTHDLQLAATSHLPYLLAIALSLSTPGEYAPLVGPGFRSASRLAATPPGMMLDVLATNRENILEALGRFREQLVGIEEQLAGGAEAGLESLLSQGSARRAELAGRPASGGGF